MHPRNRTMVKLSKSGLAELHRIRTENNDTDMKNVIEIFEELHHDFIKGEQKLSDFIHKHLHDTLRKYHNTCGDMCQNKGVDPKEYCKVCIKLESKKAIAPEGTTA